MHEHDQVWKAEYRNIIGLNGNLMQDVDSDSFEVDFKEVNEILQQLNEEVN